MKKARVLGILGLAVAVCMMPLTAGAQTPVNGVIIDNGSADGGNLQLRSSGNGTWNADNLNGNMRLFKTGAATTTFLDAGVIFAGNVFAKDMILNSGLADGSNFQFRSQGFNTQLVDNFNGILRFFIDGVIGTNLSIDAAGNVGIGTGVPSTTLDVNGTATVKILQITGGSDLAENFDIASAPADGVVGPGMVVCIDADNPGRLVVSSGAYNKTVAGIISGAGGLNPGMMMGQKASVADGQYPVALTGRVFCKVDATSAGIVPGDLLTTSDTPGHAMKVTSHKRARGAIIGKAMTPLAQGETGLVLVLVSLQ